MALWPFRRQAEALAAVAEPRFTEDEWLQRYSFDEYLQQAAWYRPAIEQTLAGGQKVQVPDGRYASHAARAASNGIVLSCMSFRQSTVSALRFAFQRLGSGGPSELYGSSQLRILERPWPGGTTQDLLARVMSDVDLGGNSYWTTYAALGERPPPEGDRLLRMAPDQVDILVADGPGRHGIEKVGYLYYPDRHRGDTAEARMLLLDQVAHVMPLPDPSAEFRGMSWLTPVMREVYGDDVMTDHKNHLFLNAATPNILVKHPPERTPQQVRDHAQVMQDAWGGPQNAGRSGHYSGLDVTVVGLNLRDLDYKLVQAAGETRIAAAAQVPPALVGLSEGLEAVSYANYRAQARRYGDITLHALGLNIAGSFEVLVPAPRVGTPSRLMYDNRQVPFMREDAAEEASIVGRQINAINAAVMNGFTADSAVAAVMSRDPSLLVHTGRVSVQLHDPNDPMTSVPSEQGSPSPPQFTEEAP